MAEVKKTNKNLQRFIATQLRRHLDKVKTTTLQTIPDAVRYKIDLKTVSKVYGKRLHDELLFSSHHCEITYKLTKMCRETFK